MSIVSLVDRRSNPPSPPKEWMFQAELEDLLYPSALTLGTTGAFYRLLGRSDAGHSMALPLRRNSVAAGLVTDEEFDAMKALHHINVRVFTLVPIAAIRMALATYGRTSQSEALIAASLGRVGRAAGRV